MTTYYVYILGNLHLVVFLCFSCLRWIGCFQKRNGFVKTFDLYIYIYSLIYIYITYMFGGMNIDLSAIWVFTRIVVFYVPFLLLLLGIT